MWVIEIRLNANQDWQTVRESWFRRSYQLHSAAAGGSLTPMTPRTLEECSDQAVESRNRWRSYEEGSMRLRNIEDNDIVPFEIFT